MFELPLFPLNSVLFPGMPLILHIFEDRYKRMIRLCLEAQQSFGVVLIKRGVEALGPLAEPHPIGCMARIVETQNLSGGRMNITAIGQERFRILTLNDTIEPYLVGSVEDYPLVNPDPPAFAASVKKYRPVADRYLRLLAETGGFNIDPEQIPGDPIAFVYMAAVLLQVPPAAKQELLSVREAPDLLEMLRKTYIREVALLRSMLAKGGAGEEKAFSRN
jgi:Lon protease-like protein